MDAKRTTKLILAVSCPKCGAAAHQMCELNTDQPRSVPHRDRRLSAADKEKTKLNELLASARSGE
jgi:hypothetical protein